MVFTDWTTISGSWSLSTGTKYSGTSSLKSGSNNGYIEHDDFSDDHAYVSLWTYTRGYAGTGIKHLSYGMMGNTLAFAAWGFMEAFFWYDPGTNTKWGRLFRDGGQVGSDINYGVGAPAAGAIQLYCVSSSMYIDQLEIWS